MFQRIATDYILLFNWPLALWPLSPRRFTTVERALQINLFMQNKANFRKSQMNVNKVLIKNYDKMDTWSIRKNEPKRTQNEPKQTQIQKGQNERK